MRRSYQSRKLARHMRKPAELLLVPMIDIFTVLVTFLLMTAVFSRTVILQLNLPASQTEFRDPPPGLPNTAAGYNYDGLTDYLKRVKAKFPEKTDASILLEPDTPYDTLVQVMDRVRVFETKQGLNTVQAELFPDISIGDAPQGDDTPAAGTPQSGATAPVPVRAATAPTAPATSPKGASSR
jgi:biopolymer transport protein ExbD